MLMGLICYRMQLLHPGCMQKEEIGGLNSCGFMSGIKFSSSSSFLYMDAKFQAICNFAMLDMHYMYGVINLDYFFFFACIVL